MEACDGHLRRRGAVRREDRDAGAVPGVHGDQRPSFQRGTQILVVGQPAVEIACEPIIGDEDMCFAAQAPAERGVPPATGACQ